MPNYILRSIDPDLWTRVKTKAASEQLPLRVLILQLLRAYADGEVGVQITRRNAD
jgi:hypothetical protein